jgi:uncharacterized membrane protein
MAFCSGCGSQVADGAAFCPKCGRAQTSTAGGAAAAPAPAVVTASAGLSDNAAGALAYVTFIPAIIFLLIEPYNHRPFVRFHSFQSIAFCVVAFVIRVALGIAFGFFGTFGLFGFLGLSSIVSLAFFIIWLMLVIKAAQGQRWELPVIGSFARQQAGS